MKNNLSRRKFIDIGVKFGIAAPAALSLLNACSGSENNSNVEEVQGSAKKLNILILGGTSFLGPHQIAYALQRGHSITTFTRGRTQPTIHQDLFSNVTSLTGDRSDDLKALETGIWDAVIDNSGHNVQWARDSAALLRERADLYLFTSSTGVYYPYLGEDIRENTDVVLNEPEGIVDEDIKTEYWYGVMKSNSEIAVKEAFGTDRSIIIRPTYMIGPADKSNRFIHWPVRLAKGGEVMVPGKPNDPVQYADVRDIAEWMIRMIENKQTGTYNGVGPANPQDMHTFVTKASQAFDKENKLIHIPDYEFLSNHHLEHLVPWIMPTGNNRGSALINNEKGIQSGLTFRELRETVRDTYDWWSGLPEEMRNKFEEDPQTALNREEAIVSDWKSRA